MSFMRKLHVSFGVVVLALILVAILPSWQHAPTGNTAIIAAGKLEKDFYDWDQRHAAVMAIKDAVKPEVLLIGDSITHLWGGGTRGLLIERKSRHGLMEDTLQGPVCS